MDDCIFCKIINKEIPCNKVYEDDAFIVFHDIHPKAKVHVLVVPKTHIVSLNELQTHDQPMLGQLMLLLPTIAAQLGLNNGFRTVINTGKEGGQEVNHLHVHILGGRLMLFK